MKNITKKITALGLAGLINAAPQTVSTKTIGIDVLPANFRYYHENNLGTPTEIDSIFKRQVNVPDANYEAMVDIPKISKTTNTRNCRTKLYCNDPNFLNFQILYFGPSTSYGSSNTRYRPWKNTSGYTGTEVAYIKRISDFGPTVEFRVGKDFTPIKNIGIDFSAGMSNSRVKTRFVEGTEKYGEDNDERTTKYSYDETEKNAALGIKYFGESEHWNYETFLSYMRYMRDYNIHGAGENLASKGWAVTGGVNVGLKLWRTQNDN